MFINEIVKEEALRGVLILGLDMRFMRLTVVVVEEEAREREADSKTNIAGIIFSHAQI